MTKYKNLPPKIDLPDLRKLSPTEMAELIQFSPLEWNAAKKLFDRLHPNQIGQETRRQKAARGIYGNYSRSPRIDLSSLPPGSLRLPPLSFPLNLGGVQLSNTSLILK
jgi:hypothetical protein